MREILLRGKEIKTGEWVQGSLVIRKDESPVPETNELYRQYFIVTEGFATHEYEVIPATVGQFTGLLDKNGAKIFEGDIIRVRGCNHEIRYVNCAFVFTNTDLILNEGLLMNNPMEVIGNIHDNPELLEANDA